MKRNYWAGAAVLAVTFIAGCGTGSGPEAAVPQTAPVYSTSSGGSARDVVNAIRAGANKSGVKRNPTLDAVARAHAQDMAARNFFSHTGSNGSNVTQRVKRAGYRWCFVAENISKGYSTQNAAIESWRTSPGHYRNLVSSKSQEFGLANAGNYWVMVLAAKSC